MDECLEIICCCCSLRGMFMCCLIASALVGWSVAISMGILRQPTYEEVVRPLRVARQYYFSKTPTSADDGFILFDRDADGLITQEDIQEVVWITSGERPTQEQVTRYIARADGNGDGALNETEYLTLLHEERRIRGLPPGPIYFKRPPPPPTATP